MCLALPARVIERLAGGEAIVDLGGVRKRISLALVPEARVGDHVIVHVGHAIGVLDADEAEATLRLLADLAATWASGEAPIGPTGTTA